VRASEGWNRVDVSLNLFDYPSLVLVFSLFVLWAAARIGAFVHSRQVKASADHEWYEDFALLLGAALTLLSLLVGFTFSLAVSSYEQRRNYERREANAIGTEYVRADLLPPSDATKVRSLLTSYLALRVQDYKNRDDNRRRLADTQTVQLQSALWSTVVTSVAIPATPATALAISGMNDVLNAQADTQAAWRNRVPVAAWSLLIAISVFSNALIGYGTHRGTVLRFLILPIALAISFFLIADIDSPRAGMIHVALQNLQTLYDSLH